MAEANPSWGAPRIHGELLKLGIEVSERTVSRLMPQRRGISRSPFGLEQFAWVSVSVRVVPHPQTREEACSSQQLVVHRLDQEHGSPARMLRKSFLQSDIDIMLPMRREEPLFRIRNRWRTVPGVRLMRRAVFRTANSERGSCRNKD